METRGSQLFHFIVIGAFLAGLYLYAGSLQVGFVGDDYVFLHTSRTLDDVSGAFTGDWFWKDQEFIGARYYRPLIIMLVYIELQLFGPNAAWFHVTNLLMHILCTIFVYWLTRQCLARSCIPHAHAVALLATLLFWLHPRHPEAVTMINGRTDVQCVLFTLASLCTYLHWKLTEKHLWYWVSLIGLVVALLSKEMAITLPAVLLLIELAERRRFPTTPMDWIQTLRPTLLHWGLVIAIFGALRTWALGGQLFGEESYIITDQQHLLFLFDSLCKLVLLLLIPTDSLGTWLSDELPDLHLALGGEGPALGLMIFLLLCVMFTVYCIRRGSWLGTVGIGLWVISSAPIINQLSDVDSQVGDRYLYLPSVGAMLLLVGGGAWLLQRNWTTKAVGLVGTAALTLIFCVQLHTDIGEWMIAGDTAFRIQKQMEELDAQRFRDERFVVFNVPVFYKDKTVLHGGLGLHVMMQPHIEQHTMRPNTFLHGITTSVPPDQVEVSIQREDNHFILTHQDAYISYPLSTWVGISSQTNVEFEPEVLEVTLDPLQERMLLLVYQEGKLVPLNPEQSDVMIAVGNCGETWVQRDRLVRSPETEPFRRRGQVGDIVTRLGHDPTRAVHLSSGDLNGDGWPEYICSFGPTDNPETQFPGMVIPYQVIYDQVLGHPYTPFPQFADNILENRLGEVRTAIGRFIPGSVTNQLVCVTGRGGQQVVRLYEYTGEPMPNGWKIVAQVRAFEEDMRALNTNGGVTISAGDLDNDGLDELVVGQTPGDASTTAIQVISFAAPDEDGLSWIAHRSPWVEVFPADMQMGGGVVHCVADSDGDGVQEIIAGSMGWERIEDAEPVGGYIIRIDVEHTDGRITGLGANRENMVQVFSPEECPSGAVSLSSGNLDFDSADELVLSTAFYPALLNGEECASMRERFPEPRVRVGKLVRNEDGMLLEPIPIIPENEWQPFASHDERALSASVQTIPR